MAITDNNFTAEELTGAMQANPALIDLLSGFITSDVNKEHPLRAKIEPVLISPVTSRHATEFESIVKEYTGEEKLNANEKYYDYGKRALGKVKGTLTQITTERDQLKAKSSEGLTTAEKERLQTLEAAILTKDKDWGDKLTAKEKEIADLKTGTTLESALSKVRSKYKSDIPALFITLAEDKAKSDLAKMVKIQENGALTFVGADGKVIVNTSNFQPATAEELIEPLLKDLIDAGKQTAGAGTKESTAGETGGDTKGKFTTVPATVKTKVDLSDYLMKLGYTDDDAEFTKIMKEHGAKLPLK